MIAGVDGAAGLQLLAASASVALGRTLTVSGWCPAGPAELLSAAGTWSHRLWSPWGIIQILGVNGDAHAICAPATVTAHNWQAVTWSEKEKKSQFGVGIPV